jgi:hypothetical protein
MIRACLSILMMLVVLGCADRSSPTDTSITRTHTEHGVTIETRVESNEIGLADRIWVDDRVTWSDRTAPVFEPRDWIDTEWTLIDETSSPPALQDGVYSIQRRSLIEPFLPGTYTIPAGVVRVTLDTDTEPTLIANEPIEIEVVGVLPEQDSGELNAIPDVTRPIADNKEDTIPIIIAGAALALVSLGMVIVLLRRNTQTPPVRSMLEELRSIQSDSSMSPGEGFERLGRVFDRMDSRLRSTTEFDQMIRVCDQARYSNTPNPSVRVSAQKMAGHALELLGDDSDSARDWGNA